MILWSCWLVNTLWGAVLERDSTQVIAQLTHAAFMVWLEDDPIEDVKAPHKDAIDYCDRLELYSGWRCAEIYGNI